MATQFQYSCPHCLTKNAGFTAVYQWATGRSATSFSMSICGVCNNGMIIRSRYKSSNDHPNLIQYDLAFPDTNFTVEETWPSLELKIPKDVPENIAIFYAQGLRNLLSSQWDAAGSMFRKTLDVATKLIDSENSKKPLYQRINLLVSAGILTSAMGEWSHEIRLDGNDAVHDEEPETEQDAHSAQHFTEALLTYVYSLPAMVAANREKRAPVAAAA